LLVWEMADTATRSSGSLLLCQYALERFSGLVKMMAVETHDYTIYKGMLMERPWSRKAVIV